MDSTGIQFAGYDVGTLWNTAGGTYPGASDTIGLAATSPSRSGPIVNDGGLIAPGTTGTMQAAPFGNPVAGAIIFLLLVLGVMLLVHRFGKEQADFGNIKASAYNAMIVGLLAAATIPLYKVGFGTLATAVPFFRPVYTYVNAA